MKDEEANAKQRTPPLALGSHINSSEEESYHERDLNVAEPDSLRGV